MLTRSAVVSLISDSGSAAYTAATALLTVRWLSSSSGPVTSVTCPSTSEAWGVAMTRTLPHRVDRSTVLARVPGGWLGTVPRDTTRVPVPGR